MNPFLMLYLLTETWSSCVQVPCYVFDTDWKKHDLSPLIRVRDGFLVDDGDDTIDFYINICRSLSGSRSKRDTMN